MSQKQLIRREIKAVQQRIRGRVIGDPYPLPFDESGLNYPVYVAPGVDVGGNRVLKRVPVKINGPQARLYARNGSPVFLEKDAQGRYQIVSPADRVPQLSALTLIDEDADVATAAGNIGFSTEKQPFLYYKGVQPESFFDPAADAATLVWARAYDRVLGLPQNIVVTADADGAGIVSLVDQSGNGNDSTQLTASLQPLYRRFDPTSNNSNSRSTMDFDGVDDRLEFASPINESVNGVISIFVMLQKEVAGSGDDVALELNNWRLYSRQSGSDTWGFDQGGGVVDSGFPITTNFTLVEIVATSFADVDLYQDGIPLGNFTPGGGGLSLSSNSAIGGSLTLASHDGRVVEVLIMDETVSAVKRQAIEAYFNQTMFVAFARWGNNVDGFPKILTVDGDGNEVVI